MTFLPQTKAQEISHRVNGTVPLKQAKTLVVIDELKGYWAEPKVQEDESARIKIVDALKVEGAAAWIVHNAVKRNYDKYRKGEMVLSQFRLAPHSSY